MNKKGQVYILIAIILCLAIFSLVTVYNKVKQTSVESDFEKLSKNYEVESGRFLNELLKTNPSPDSATILNSFTTFTAFFTSYAKTQTPDFQLIYAFQYGDELYLGNYLSELISVYSDEQMTPLPRSVSGDFVDFAGCYEKIPSDITFQGITMGVPAEYGSIAGCNDYSTGSYTVIYIKIGEFVYNFQLNPNKPEIIIVSKERIGKGQVKVYLHGTLVKGST